MEMHATATAGVMCCCNVLQLCSGSQRCDAGLQEPYHRHDCAGGCQSNRAVVVGGGNKYGCIMFYDISAVLMSSSYFFNFMDAFKVS
jgi:hypothetical protein